MKKLFRAITPPIIWSVLQKFKHKNIFFGVYQGFNQVLDEKPWDQRGWEQLLRDKMNLLLTSVDKGEDFTPEPFLKGYTVVPCLMVNLISTKKECRVLDFAGGSGFVYYTIKPYLTNLPNVVWHVIDSNEIGLELGKNFSLKDDHIQFFNRLPDTKKSQYDIIYINTSLQYIEDYSGFIKDLLLYNPTYLVLTRLLAGAMKSYVTSQNVLDKRTPCKIINVVGFSEFLRSQGYKLVFKSPTIEEPLREYFEDVPDHFKIPFSLILVYVKDK